MKVIRGYLSGMYRNRRSWHRHNAFRGGQLGAGGKNQEVVLWPSIFHHVFFRTQWTGPCLSRSPRGWWTLTRWWLVHSPGQWELRTLTRGHPPPSGQSRCPLPRLLRYSLSHSWPDIKITLCFRWSTLTTARSCPGEHSAFPGSASPPTSCPSSTRPGAGCWSSTWSTETPWYTSRSARGNGSLEEESMSRCFQVPDHETITTVKTLLHEKTGVPPCQQELRWTIVDDMIMMSW